MLAVYAKRPKISLASTRTHNSVMFMLKTEQKQQAQTHILGNLEEGFSLSKSWDSWLGIVP